MASACGADQTILSRLHGKNGFLVSRCGFVASGFVFLLHATRLNADSIDQLAAILKANNLRPTTLDNAMKDPAYRIADTYAGPDGDEWLSRWSLTLHKELPWDSFGDPPKDIQDADDRLEPSP